MSTSTHYEESGYSVEWLPDTNQLRLIGTNLKTGKSQSKTILMCDGPHDLLPVQVRTLRDNGADPSKFFRVGSDVVRIGARAAVEGWHKQHRAEMDRRIDEEDARLIAACPGLEVLRAVVNDEDRYARQFERMMDDENNDGARPPRGVQVSYRDAAARYPRAALYIRAEGYSCASHWAKAKAGAEAMAILAAGGPEEEAAARLENWLSDNNVEVD